MANKKAHKTPAECQAQFYRTVKKTGKWRGNIPATYKKHVSKKDKKIGDFVLIKYRGDKEPVYISKENFVKMEKQKGKNYEVINFNFK